MNPSPEPPAVEGGGVPRLPGLRRPPASAIRAADPEPGDGGAIRLGLGAPTWFAGAEGLPSPARRALAAVREAPYGAHAGEAGLRRAIAERAGVSPRSVLVTCGAQGGLHALFFAVLGRGDLALVPDPGFPAYAALARMAGGEAATYALGGAFEL
ncbi:MAG: aminotransferase class I/II-fold pyridoxal phosphate-dependent enzyme, partial [Acidobacteriota bacterium]